MDREEGDRPLGLPRRWRPQRLTALDRAAKVVELIAACGAPQCPFEDVCARHERFGEFEYGPASTSTLHPCDGFIEKVER